MITALGETPQSKKKAQAQNYDIFLNCGSNIFERKNILHSFTTHIDY